MQSNHSRTVILGLLGAALSAAALREMFQEIGFEDRAVGEASLFSAMAVGGLWLRALFLPKT
jgi:hypothetical protein